LNGKDEKIQTRKMNKNRENRRRFGADKIRLTAIRLE
jgi:hypothetical protein